MSIYSRLQTTLHVLLHGLPRVHDQRSEPRSYRPPSRYDQLLNLFRARNPVQMIEIGVWRGERSMQFILEGMALRRYIGFDLFEDMTDEKHNAESMGNCIPHSKTAILKKLEPLAEKRQCALQLIAGPTETTLPPFAEVNAHQFDFIYIDGGHSLETVENDWAGAQQLLAPGGVAVFDDYYTNDDSRGAKPLIDRLLHDDRYRIRFFPIIEDIIDDLQITMVAVYPRSTQEKLN